MPKVLEEIRKELDHCRLNKQYQQQRCPSELKKRILALKKEVGVRELVKQLNLHYDFFSLRNEFYIDQRFV